MQIDQSHLLVTGGSSGLGAACVRSLARQGARVTVADLASPREEVQKELGDRVLYVRTDVTSEADMQAAITAGEAAFGSLRGVVACAGVLHAERLLPREGVASLDAFRRAVDINLNGTFNTMRLAAEAISRSEPDTDGERGVMVMTSSVAAFEGQVGQAAYAASKGAVASLTLPLARELSQHGIRVVSIAPGIFDTPMMQAAPDKVRQSLIDQTLFPKRLGEPDDFASLVTHVFNNAMLNGCTLRLDGAVRMGPR
ncbi:2,5-dichloro-2,5-cyclohexadiene-1,4-diol dehydrogenase [Novipirellula galeiformis]|uniref:2,5-dichloro-2,5-cyclohexadiene-1,4-diol dehydrogenase n=1 Tax=Novipirellula galeiformis TaxID=2528004 RepID=A0A5C6CM24_9BACT|nr:SDR family NAD(P)-dependent oxidoreductase [Novipirellula galeiformis]TWU25402.1 2,5-dichloro-2,5-cyclohexadiene-1,4-diol dehydrogenase [Novipirellula galeiformis]